MKASSQIQAAIDLLSQIEEERRPADRILSSYFRSRRYIGSKDKAAISEIIYAVLRNKGSYLWYAEQSNLSLFARSLVMLYLIDNKKDLDEYFTGEEYAPEILSDIEAMYVVLASRAMQKGELENAPDYARLNLPQWLLPKLKKSLADDFEQEILAMQNRADLCIRANLLKNSREDCQQQLKAEKVDTSRTLYSPWGLKILQKIALNNLSSFKEGLFEVQDQGSQLITLVSGVKPGQKVVDFCAGAGGKSLALAAQMQNKGVIHACDVHSKRLENLTKRKKRAGVHNIQLHLLSSERDKWVKRQTSKMDVVLVDAPCSGTGTWRRSPDARWNLDSENLESLVILQTNILSSASRLVKPGGRLIYATCSVLVEENEEQVEKFLKLHSEFEVGELSNLHLLDDLNVVDNFQLRTSIAHTGMDGFYVAVLQRKSL